MLLPLTLSFILRQVCISTSLHPLINQELFNDYSDSVVTVIYKNKYTNNCVAIINYFYVISFHEKKMFAG